MLIYLPQRDNFPAVSDELNEFKEWMDSRGLKTKDVAEDLHVEEQTVRNWRSQGVPERRAPHVQRYMAEWKAPAVSSAVPRTSVSDQVVADFVASRQNLVLHPEPEVFRAWTAAFKHSRAADLEQWAIDGLSELAKRNNLKVEPKADEEEGNGTEGK